MHTPLALTLIALVLSQLPGPDYRGFILGSVLLSGLALVRTVVPLAQKQPRRNLLVVLCGVQLLVLTDGLFRGISALGA